MRSLITGFAMLTLLAASCKKDPDPVTQPPVSEKKVLLKDIVMPNLPSPYYHFQYGPDSSILNASFASDLNSYDIIYDRGRIIEMRSNTFSNKDTLRYLYDNNGKLGGIRFINDAGITYRHAFIAYQGDKISEIEWDHREGNVGYLIDRNLTFTYYPDGNLKEVKEHRPAVGTQDETNFSTLYEQYDDKTNVDDFSLLHDGFHDHLFLLTGIRLQKNNPHRETRMGNGVNYTVDYTYTYNADGTPLVKAGTLLFSNGQQAGQTFHTTSTYSYY